MTFPAYKFADVDEMDHETFYDHVVAVEQVNKRTGIPRGARRGRR